MNFLQTGVRVEDETAETRQFSTFRIVGLLMGIDLDRVQELLRFQTMTRVPRAPQAVEGLMNLRGQIVTVLDTRRILGLPARESRKALPMNIVVRADDGPVSLLVDEICDVLDVPVSLSAGLPENLPKAQREFLDGVYQLENDLLLILNTARALACAG